MQIVYIYILFFFSTKAIIERKSSDQIQSGLRRYFTYSVRMTYFQGSNKNDETSSS